jgi:hypothetical protein
MSNLPDPFEFLKSLWGPMGLPMAGMASPTLDLNEIDKRIADLKSVENWLNMNLGALRATIQGFEMQRATLAAMQGAGGQSAKPAARDASPEVTDAAAAFADAWKKMLEQNTPPAGGSDKK